MRTSPSARSSIRPAARRTFALLESLESRTLLSVTVAGNNRSATFTDVDGDLVTVSVSKGTLTEGLFTTAASGLGEQLQSVDLTNASFTGANVTISVKQANAAPLGDGLTNVGYINATGRALGKVVVAGDLGRLDAGLSAAKGVTALTVFSLGRQGLASQGGVGSLTSNLTALGSLTVTTDIQDAFVNVTGNLGTVKIGGSLIGGAAADSGSVQAGGNIGNVTVGQDLFASNDAGATNNASIQSANGKIGNVTIGGSVRGGAADNSAEIFADDTLGKVVIGGDLVGGGGDFSGQLDADTIASVTVNGSLIGDAGEASGGIFAGKIGNVTVGGSVIGGSGTDSAGIFSNGDLGKVAITGNLIGGDANSASAFYTGYVEAGGKIASVTVGGSVVSGTNGGAGSLLSGSIRAGRDIGSITIKGSLVGNASLPAIISAATKIGAITINGRADNALILAGYDVNLAATNGNAQITKLTVLGDWIASTVAAGIDPGTDTLFGTNDDFVIVSAGAGTSRITTIVIAGQIFGSAGGGDHFAFAASRINSFTAAGVKAKLTSGFDIIEIGGTDDVTLREVPFVT